MSKQAFSYGEFTTRNIGFVTPAQQERLRGAKVFVAGVGGMGGAAVMCLVRSGVGHIKLADLDTFEVSNLNRQMVATMETVGEDKAESTVAAIRAVNPECVVENMGEGWVDRLDEILPTVDLVINGCDDARATITLMRRAAHHGKTVIDAFAALVPNVYVVKPSDPRPEQTFGYPTVGMAPEAITAEVAKECLAREIEWVLIHSSSADYVQLDIAAELITGQRKRFSFAPMVWTTGCMMAYEAIRLILELPGGPGPRGLFFDPWAGKVERPLGAVLTAVKRKLVRRFLARLTGA
jgi:molybdopterin-synthase adenylyltransferase